MRRRHRRVHRPDGGALEHRCGRPERVGAGRHHAVPHRQPLRRVREDRRAAAHQRGRAQGGHRRVHLPVGGDADHQRPGVRPSHPRPCGFPRRPLAVPPRAAQALLRDARAGRRAHHRARERPPVRGQRLRHRGRGKRDGEGRAAVRRARPSEEPRRHPGFRSGAPAPAVRQRGGIRPVQEPSRPGVRASRGSHVLRRHGLPRHRRRLHHVQSRAHRRGRRPFVVALRQQQRRRAGLRAHGALQPVQRDAGGRRHGRAARAHRPRHGDGLRRASAVGGVARGLRRDRDGGAPARGAGDAAGRRVHPRHRRPGHEVPAREGRHHRPYHAQRGVQLGLRQLHRELRHGPQLGRGRVRADRHQGRAPRRSGQPLHRVHEQPREAGAEGRRHGGRHRRGPGHLRHQERAVQGHQDPRPARRGHEGHRAGRHVPQRRRAARVRAAVRGPSRASRHRGQHGRVRCRAARARPLPLRRGAGSAQGRGRRRVELGERGAGRSLRRALEPAHARAASGVVAHAQDRALQGVLQPLPAHRQRLRRGRGHGQAPPLHHGQPLREGRGHVRREQGRRAEPLRIQEQPLVRLRAACARERPARQRGHPARAQSVRELSVLVHVLHEARFPGGAVRPVHEEDLRGGHRVHAVRERVLSGEAQPRAHHEPA